MHKELKFSDLFSLKELQRLQDLFADAHEVASIITHPDGRPITRPSNFTRLCSEIIRKTEKGCANCYQSDAILGSNNPAGPIVQPCLSGGLLDAGVSITVGGKHIANWLIGQVRNNALDEAQMLAYADDIGVNREDFKQALQEIPQMSLEKFDKIAQLLFAFANELSAKSFHKLLLQLQIEKQEKVTKQLEESREFFLKSKQQYDNLVSHIPVGVYVLHSKPEGTFALDYASPRMAEMLSVSAESLIADGEAIFKAIHPDDLEEFIRLNQEGIKLKRPFDWNGRVIAEGVVKWVHIASMPQELENGEVLWNGLIGDVTEQTKVEAENKLQNEELVSLNATKDRFFSIIAHDLKSPFSSILGFSHILLEQIQKKDYDGIDKYAEIIQLSSKRAMDLLMNLMEWSQSQTGRMEFNPEYFELVELIKETELLFAGAIEQKSMIISKIAPSRVPVYADKKMISTVLRNLISNAIKFTHPGGMISITIEEKQAELMVSVSDNGVGISENRIKKMFLIAENYSTPDTQNEKGTGLGMILCKEFIEKHGGKIWVESEVGKGSTFFFTIIDQNKG